MGDTLYILDGHSQIYRAYFAPFRDLTSPSGEPTRATYVFTSMLLKLLADKRPSHVAMAIDGPRSGEARSAIYPEYKATRPPMPDDLPPQVERILQIVRAFGIPVLEVPGQEADDIIATLAVQAAGKHCDVLIASQDKDFFQIVSPRIRLLRSDTADAEPLDAAGVVARYGVKPEQIVDYLSLVGDNVDNIPGVPGIGPKTAAELLGRYGTVDELLARASTLDKPKLRASVLGAGERLSLNRGLIRLETDLALPWSLETLKVQPPEQNQLKELYKRYGFHSLLAELEKQSVRGELLLDL